MNNERCDCCGAPLGKIFDENTGKMLTVTFSCEYCGASYIDMWLARTERKENESES